MNTFAYSHHNILMRLMMMIITMIIIIVITTIEIIKTIIKIISFKRCTFGDSLEEE